MNFSLRLYTLTSSKEICSIFRHFYKHFQNAYCKSPSKKVGQITLPLLSSDFPRSAQKQDYTGKNNNPEKLNYLECLWKGTLKCVFM